MHLTYIYSFKPIRYDDWSFLITIKRYLLCENCFII